MVQQHLMTASVQVAAEPHILLDGDLNLPTGARGVVLFAHGSGSSRHSPRNQYVANVLNQAGLGTLLLDLLTPDEERIDNRTRRVRFDIGLLARRLVGAIDWLTHQDNTRQLNIGLFGASTGAGGALVAAAERPSLVSAVVSRGGRPDLAENALLHVRAPTLLIVGERDETVITLNQLAFDQIPAERRLAIVPSATHLFEEPGALGQVAEMAREWFTYYLTPQDEPPPA
jgi:putative phosphoribosyl transferase